MVRGEGCTLWTQPSHERRHVPHGVPKPERWKTFVPLIVARCFPKGEGLMHPWLLPTIVTWLGALSRNHGRRAHRSGLQASAVLRKSMRGQI